MKLSVSSSVIHPPKSYNTDEFGFQYLKDCGFDACEFRIGDLLRKYTDDDEFKAKCLQVKAEAEAAGIELYQTHGTGGGGWKPEKEQEMIDLMIRSIKGTHWIGCKYCVIHPAILLTRTYERNKQESIDLAIRVYAELIPTLEEYDVYCCLENMWNVDPIFKHICPTILSRCQEMVDICNVLGDRFKICVDTGHGELTGDDPVEMVRIAGDKLAALHAHHTDSKSDLHTFPFMKNKIDKHATRNNWEEMMRALKDIGYKGAINFEISVPGPVELNQAGLECLAAIGRYLVSVYEKHPE